MAKAKKHTAPKDEDNQKISISTTTSKRWLRLWLRIFIPLLPFGILIYVLYYNFLPFGYHKTFTINVGSENDIKVGEFYLAPSADLSERKRDEKGNTYRELNGTATAVFKPKAVLKNTKITAEVKGAGVSLIPPYISFDPSTIQWDSSWDFTKKIPNDLKGNAFNFDVATAFDGKSKLELPDSADRFEDGPFSVYAMWTPKDDTSNAQQIVGHYNWELWQNNNSVSFMVGRMNDANGAFYKISYPIKNKDFFNTQHSALAIYSPSDHGFIDLYVDGSFAGRNYFGTDKIWKDYNGDKNLTFGKSGHGVATNFKGSLYQVDIAARNILPEQSKINFTTRDDLKLNIAVVSSAISSLEEIRLDVAK